LDASEPLRSSAGQRGLHRLRFGLERLVLRGLRYRLLIAAAIVAAVALVAGGLIALLDSGFSELSKEVWWAFLRLTDPGYLGDDEGMARRTVSTVVTVLGYVLFLGLLIAILTQWLNDLIRKLEAGVTPVALSDHVILLGWTHRTPAIVRELLGTGGRLQRFLARRGARDLRIVILAEHVDDALTRELRERLGDLWSDRRVFLRSGTPLRVDHLERVAFRDAAVLILPGADFAERRPEIVDAQTVKTLMAVSKHARESGAPHPLAVAELFDGCRAIVARQAYAGDSEILAADDIIGRLIAESVRQRGLCSVFTELLTLHRGCALYVRQIEELAGSKFRDAGGAFSRAILIGTVRPGEGWPALNPDPETVLEAKDLLVFVARSFEDCVPGATAQSSTPISSAAPLQQVSESRRVLILGWSRKVPALLEDFARYGADAFEIDVVSATPVEEREAALERHASDSSSGRVRQIVAGFTAPGVLERLEPQRYDNIVLVASERLDEEKQADATTVFAYLMLRGLLPEESPRPEVFVELLDEENEFLFERECEDVIVSPMLVSYLISQVALCRELAAVFAELSRPQGARFVLQPAQEYLATNGPVRFEDLDRAAAARGEIAIGLRRTEGPDGGLTLNPDRDAEWTLASSDEVVVLASYTEAEGEEQP
jgi:hypothetical protein